MKILIICKRQYTRRDLLDDQYGRLFEIPEALSLIGMEVKGITLSYRSRPEGERTSGTVQWQSLNGLPFLPTTFFKHCRVIQKTIDQLSPDLIWASSDAYQIIAAAYISKKNHIPFIADLYDNYESFALTKLPLVKFLFRRACAQANGVTAVTHTLCEHIKSIIGDSKLKICTIGNAINPNRFFHYEKSIARKELNLPLSVKLIGTAGALDTSRGIEVLLAAFDRLSSIRDDVYLVLAGPKSKLIEEYQNTNLIYLGNLPTSSIPFLFSALDVAVICNRKSDFGLYCYPQKFDEINACRTLCVAANVGEMTRLMEGKHQNLFDFDDDLSLATKIEYLLEHGGDLFEAATWTRRASQFLKFAEEIIER